MERFIPFLETFVTVWFYVAGILLIIISLNQMEMKTLFIVTGALCLSHAMYSGKLRRLENLQKGEKR